jgi:hypothetical protein
VGCLVNFTIRGGVPREKTSLQSLNRNETNKLINCLEKVRVLAAFLHALHGGYVGPVFAQTAVL